MIARVVANLTSAAVLLTGLVSIDIVARAAADPANDPAPSASSQDRHGPIIIHERHGKNVTSGNWSGYAVTGAKGSVTDVKGSWIVPAIAGTCPSTNQYSSFWVGIDGYTSSTVEQIGTDSDCVNGKAVYYAWYEFYPHFSYTIPLTVKPGDTIFAEVTAQGKGQFTVTLTDKTTPGTFSKSAKIPSADQSSAEWIAEAPYSGGILPLADFNTVSFGQDYTAQTGTCFATIAGASRAIGLFPAANVFDITMDTSSGMIKASPSVLSSDATSFSIAWVSAGP